MQIIEIKQGLPLWVYENLTLKPGEQKVFIVGLNLILPSVTQCDIIMIIKILGILVHSWYDFQQ